MGEAAEAEDGVVITLGMHLCGALSPRLLALASGLDAISAFAVCPCCIKGSLGDHVKRSAKAARRPNYDVLLETLDGLCVRALGDRGTTLGVRRVDEMLSPRNGFVRGVKARGRDARAGGWRWKG